MNRDEERTELDWEPLKCVDPIHLVPARIPPTAAATDFFHISISSFHQDLLPQIGLLWPFWAFYRCGLWAKFVYFRDFCNVSNSSLTPADILSGNLVSLYCPPVFTVHYYSLPPHFPQHLLSKSRVKLLKARFLQHRISANENFYLQFTPPGQTRKRWICKWHKFSKIKEKRQCDEYISNAQKSPMQQNFSAHHQLIVHCGVF